MNCSRTDQEKIYIEMLQVQFTTSTQHPEIDSNRISNTVGSTCGNLRWRSEIFKTSVKYALPSLRAEPVLARIKEDHRRIILPSIDNIKHDTFEVERYENSGHGYNWELWCMYINPPKQWWDEGDMSAPIRQVGTCAFTLSEVKGENLSYCEKKRVSRPQDKTKDCWVLWYLSITHHILWYAFLIVGLLPWSAAPS